MYSNDYFHNSDEILDKLTELDFHCKRNGVVSELVILGGSGILLYMEMQNVQFRPTQDIDVNIIRATDVNEAISQLREGGFDIVGGVSELPPREDYIPGETIFELDLDLDALKVYVPSIEILACTKLFSKREKDYLDLKNTNILNQCDKETLLDMVEEYKPYMLNPEDTAYNVHELLHFFEERGI